MSASSQAAATTAIVPRAGVRHLQMAVLRPGQPITAADLVDEPGAFYVGAYTSGGSLASAASMLPEPYPLELPPRAGTAWRLRGMATDPARQGQGFGQAVLRRAMDEVRQRGGDYVWCNARTVARPFYQGLGFVAMGAEFVITLPDGTPIPHYVMWRAVDQLGSGSAVD